MAKTFADYIKDGDDAMQKRDIDLAIASYSRAIPLATGVPTDEVEAYLKRAWAYCVREMYAEAIQDCSNVLSIDVTNVKALQTRAFAYYETNRLTDAKSACTTILSLTSPKKTGSTVFRTFAYELQMLLLSEEGKFDEVLTIYEKALRDGINSFLIMQNSVDAFTAL